MASALDMLSHVARSALAWAETPHGVAVLAGGASTLCLALVLVVFLRRRGGGEPIVAPSISEAALAEPRVLILKLIGDVDNAAGVRLAAVLERRFDGVAAVAHVGGSPIKPGGDLDDEVRHARALARRARVGLTAWGEVEGGVLRLRLLKRDEEHSDPEAYALPAHLRPPFDFAAAACVAAVGAETPVLAGLRTPLAHAADEIAAALASEPPEDPQDVARLHAALARARLALDRLEPGRGHLQGLLAATAVSDPRRTSEPLEWAEARALRDQALARDHTARPEPPAHEIRERVDACRGVLRVWTNALVTGKIVRAELALAEALLELADRGDQRAAEEIERMMEAALARRQAQPDPSWTLAATALLGAARLRLGEREPRTARLEAAEHDLRRALALAESAGDRARAASVKDDLARVLARLGERDRGSERLRAAAGMYRTCVAEDGREDLARARARAALGRTLVHVGERDRDPAAVDEAVAALRTAAKSLADIGAAAAATQARRALERAERLYAELRAGQAAAGAKVGR